MFSFHKPKVYRSSTGCCICKAKSSSSRFTDSKKYEEDFLECFQLVAPRQGEICNACVLLVKRWKKLPAGSDRNWRHVVDARAGPGMKSMTKFKSKNKKLIENTAEKIEKIVKKKKRKLEREMSPSLSDHSDTNHVDGLDEFGESTSRGSSRVNSPVNSDCEENSSEIIQNKNTSRRRKATARKLGKLPELSGFVDLNFWKREVICCGTIYRGPNDELLIDPRYLKPCSARLALTNKNLQMETNVSVETNSKLTLKSPLLVKAATDINSDSSSDSGYDENSIESIFKNQNKNNEIFKNLQHLKNDNISHQIN